MNGRNAGCAPTARTMTLARGGAAAIVASVLLGVPIVGAQTTTPSTSDSQSDTANQKAQLLYEQTRPRTVVPFNPQDFDKYVGSYEFESNSTVFVHIFRKEEHYFVQLTGQGPVETYPESATKFFATVVAAQISFVTDATGQVTGLVLHQNGLLQSAKKISDAFAAKAAAELQQRINDKTPSPGTEASLRRWIEAMENGEPNYNDMAPALAQAAREQWPRTRLAVQQLGAFQSLAFERVAPTGADVYIGTFTHGTVEINIAPLSADGKVNGRNWRLLP
jgi:hypothetical protein